MKGDISPRVSDASFSSRNSKAKSKNFIENNNMMINVSEVLPADVFSDDVDFNPKISSDETPDDHFFNQNFQSSSCSSSAPNFTQQNHSKSTPKMSFENQNVTRSPASSQASGEWPLEEPKMENLKMKDIFCDLPGQQISKNPSGKVENLVEVKKSDGKVQEEPLRCWRYGTFPDKIVLVAEPVDVNQPLIGLASGFSEFSFKIENDFKN